MNRRKIKCVRFISPTGQVKTFPRLNKLIALFKEMDFEVEIVYWDRDGQTDLSGLDIRAVPLLRGGGYATSKLKIYYILYVIRVALFAFSSRGCIVYSIGTVSAFPVAVARILGGSKFIFDNNDNLSLSHKWPYFIKKLISSAEKFIASQATLHIVPSKNRWKSDDDNLRILPNFPSSNLFYRARDIAKKNSYIRSQSFTVYINGLMSSSRGWEMISKTMKDTRLREVKFIIAGNLNSAQIEEIKDVDNIAYLGNIDSETALANYYRSHIALTFYDPSIEINRMAEPTKWGDCVATHTPFISNYGIDTAIDYVEKGICTLIEYDNYEQLIEVLVKINMDTSWCNNMERAFEKIEFNFWEVRAKEIFAVEYN